MFDHIGQFSHISRPRVLFEYLDRFVCEHVLNRCMFGSVSQIQMSSKGHDIFHPFAKGRHVNLKGIDAKHQILPKRSGFYHAVQIAMRCADNPNVNMKCLVIADPPNIATLQYSQKLCLHGQRQFTDFIEENGAAVGHFEKSFSLRVCTGEGTLFVAEQFAFD